MVSKHNFFFIIFKTTGCSKQNKQNKWPKTKTENQTKHFYVVFKMNVKVKDVKTTVQRMDEHGQIKLHCYNAVTLVKWEVSFEMWSKVL